MSLGRGALNRGAVGQRDRDIALGRKLQCSPDMVRQEVAMSFIPASYKPLSQSQPNSSVVNLTGNRVSPGFGTGWKK
jgi:hypothetical protein